MRMNSYTLLTATILIFLYSATVVGGGGYMLLTLINGTIRLWDVCVDYDQPELIYGTDPHRHVVKKVNLTSGAVATMAGKLGEPGCVDGPSSQARFNKPRGLCRSRITGEIFVVDSGNYLIRSITPKGNVTTILGDPRHAGVHDGADGEAWLTKTTWDLVCLANGSVLVTDPGTHSIRMIVTAEPPPSPPLPPPPLPPPDPPEHPGSRTAQVLALLLIVLVPLCAMAGIVLAVFATKPIYDKFSHILERRRDPAEQYPLMVSSPPAFVNSGDYSYHQRPLLEEDLPGDDAYATLYDNWEATRCAATTSASRTSGWGGLLFQTAAMFIPRSREVDMVMPSPCVSEPVVGPPPVGPDLGLLGELSTSDEESYEAQV